MRFVTNFLILVLVLSTTACSSQAPKKEFDRTFKNIALVSPRTVMDVVEIETRGERAQEGAGKGLAAGTIGGAAIGAIACGPFLYGLCVTALMSGGMLAGSATGVLYGLSGFPKDDARELEKQVEILSSKHDFSSTMVENISQQLPPEMIVDPEYAEIQAVLFIENMEFKKVSGGAQLLTTIRASFESTESRRVPQYGSRNFTGESSTYEVDEWLDIDSGQLEQAIRESLSTASEEIVELLNARWEP